MWNRWRFHQLVFSNMLHNSIVIVTTGSGYGDCRSLFYSCTLAGPLTNYNIYYLLFINNKYFIFRTKEIPLLVQNVVLSMDKAIEESSASNVTSYEEQCKHQIYYLFQNNKFLPTDQMFGTIGNPIYDLLKYLSWKKWELLINLQYTTGLPLTPLKNRS